jgi:hypothetical protein
MGRFELLAGQSPAAVLPWLKSATALNPQRGAYWLDRATTEELIGSPLSQRESLAHALAADPHSASLGWEIANRFVAQGATDDALEQYRRVIENDPELMPQAIQICWNIRPDINSLLKNVIPPNADAAFLSILVSDHQPDAAARVWDRIVALQQPVERPFLFDYLRHLIEGHDPVQAVHVWQQAADLSGLAAYQPTEENLLVNGNFSLAILNGGFDWTYTKMPVVTLALDPIDGHSGSRSLRIFFEGPGIVDAGIRQLVAVEPNTQYTFSGYYKAEEMDGAGGPKFAMEDFYSGEEFFMSDDLRGPDSWTMVRGTFTTGSDTHLLTLRIARVPAGSPIRGKLWIDDLKLTAADHLASAAEVHP